MRQCLLALLLAFGVALPAASVELHSYAIVRTDASLIVQGRVIRLFGLHIPATEQTCQTTVTPVRCAPRAALVLDAKIQRFVRCAVAGENTDGTLSAVCFVRGNSVLAPEVDLAAWLIAQGWAVAAPGAPFEYAVLEQIARERGVGVWGVAADDLRRLRRRQAPLN